MRGIDEEAEEYGLSTCPFCGNDSAMFISCREVGACGEFNRCGQDGSWAVACSFTHGGCGSSSGFFQTKQEAAQAWNRRPAITIDGPEIGELIRLSAERVSSSLR